MPNSFGGTLWSLDTVGVIARYPLYVKSLKVIAEGAAGGENIIILDPVTGALLWEILLFTGNFSSSEMIEAWWTHGMDLASLGGLAGARVLVDLG